MHKDTTPQPQWRFEITVEGRDYRALLDHFRGERPAATRPQRQVSALVDLDPTFKQFTITCLGKHRLPKTLRVKPDSSTYHNLTQAISREAHEKLLDRTTVPSLAYHLQQIAALCPTVSATPLHIDPHDLEIKEATGETNNRAPFHITLSTLARLAPSVLLDIDDSPTLVVQTSEPLHHNAIEDALSEALRHSPPLLTRVSGNIVEIHHSLLLPPTPEGVRIELYLHWGSYEELAPAWSDELLATVITTPVSQQVPLYFRTHVPVQGYYGATLYARLHDGAHKIWLGNTGAKDAIFRISQDDSPSLTQHHNDNEYRLNQARNEIKSALTHDPLQMEPLQGIANRYPNISIGALLSEALTGTAENEYLRLLSRASSDSSDHIARSISTSYGINELVFASPEGSHATAGGLAQVLSGLPPELAKLGIPVSIISPLFRHENGNKHPSADTILTRGLLIRTERVVPRYIATIQVPLGPTFYRGTQWTKQAATTIECKVYLAQKDNIRVFLLANSSIFDRIYYAVPPNEQLRRAIVFSRAVLETIACEKLTIRPSAIISNDWMTACIPVYAALDHRYNHVPWIRASKTIHMIHNGGADYHGRLPVNYNDEDLWPLFNLAPEHYFGFRDPHDGSLLNLTAAATQHARGGVLTVSQPYAQQLVSSGGADGLEHSLGSKRAVVFGISNGINRTDIDTWFGLRTGLTKSDLKHASHIIPAKAALRRDIQRQYGLTVDSKAVLLSLVGRLAEQKGLSLLSGLVDNQHRSTLEDILVKQPDTQILIAGPMTPGDAEATALCNSIGYLMHRYPGRIAAVFDYISHSQALEIIAASSLFLMPSRFEPGGITQLEALALGTPVVGRAVGGIKATIENFNSEKNAGTGFLCEDYTPSAFANTVHWALDICAHENLHQSIVQQALEAKHSWVDRAPTFAAVVQKIVIGEQRAQSLELLKAQQTLTANASVA